MENIQNVTLRKKTQGNKLHEEGVHIWFKGYTLKKKLKGKNQNVNSKITGDFHSLLILFGISQISTGNMYSNCHNQIEEVLFLYVYIDWLIDNHGRKSSKMLE